MCPNSTLIRKSTISSLRMATSIFYIEGRGGRGFQKNLRYSTTGRGFIVCMVGWHTVWSEGYKVAPPELKISPIMYFIRNIENRCAIRAKFWQNWFLLFKIGYFDNNRHRQIEVKMAQWFSIFWITLLNCGWQNT